MILEHVFNQYVKKTPVTVMARATFEYALSPQFLNEMFEKTARVQYTRELLFSSVVDLMSLVVTKTQPSVRAAYSAIKGTLPASLSAMYEKLNHTEPAVTSGMVRATSQRLRDVIEQMGGQLPPLLPGVRVKIIDGSHLAATQRRLEVLRGSIAGPLPGHCLVVLDPQLMLATDMIPCEDGHAQERSLSGQILELICPSDLWIADRNFCTMALLLGIAQRGGYFGIRQHASMPLATVGTTRRCGQIETGEVFEHKARIRDANGQELEVRRIVVKLNSSTRDGDKELSILTNLPKSVASATTVADLYRKRWKIETLFQSMTTILAGEIDSLAYPKAALLGYGTALVAHNILATLHAALRAEFGAEKVEEQVSAYLYANEIRTTARGMLIVLEPETWTPYQTMTPPAMAEELRKWASFVDLSKYPRARRGAKKPVPKRTRFRGHTHVSTARLLTRSQN